MSAEASAAGRCGLVALIGRPNVGKSTLLNHLVGQKLSITSRKPQTTRQRLLGIKTIGTAQLVYVDTPGFHSGYRKALNRHMNRTISDTIRDVDVILFLVDGLRFTPDDDKLLEGLAKVACPVFLVINKVDTIEEKARLLPFIAAARARFGFAEIIPVSALKEHNTAELEQTLIRHLPENPWLYPEDQLTDRTARFLAAEFVREKVTRQMGDELPYEAAVEIEEFKVEKGVHHIGALILVEKPGQKKMLIGAGGSRLKLIGSEARHELEKLFGGKVMLRLWVKVKTGWSDDERALQSLGFE